MYHDWLGDLVPGAALVSICDKPPRRRTRWRKLPEQSSDAGTNAGEVHELVHWKPPGHQVYLLGAWGETSFGVART